MNSAPKITLAVLTWKAPKTLESSLESISSLLPIFAEKILVCQESDPREIEIGNKYGFRVIALEKNVGIQNGMKHCFEEAANSIVLFYENDLNLRVDPAVATRVIYKGAEALAGSEVDFVKLRYLPGNKTTKGKLFDKYWTITGGKLKKKLPAYLRPKKADLLLSGALLYLTEHNVSAPGFNPRHEDFLLSTTALNKWENRAVLTTKKFFNILIDFAENNPTARTVNGTPDLEHPLNCKQNRKWFLSLEAKLLIAVPGVFGHRRYDRSEDDEKWGMVDPADDGGDVSIS